MAEDRCAECGQDLRFCQGHALEGCGCFPVPIYCPKHDAVDDLLAALEAFTKAFGPVERRQLAVDTQHTYLNPAGVMIPAEIAEAAQEAIRKAKP